MSEMSKKARAALREKAKRLSTEKDMKTDSSDWTPAEPLEAQAKTGMRPVSRRAFKKGGKVMGEASVKHAGRKARKSGGRLVAENDKKEAKDIAIAKMNRNQKEANAERDGIKHVGGMKKGGRATCNIGGAPAGTLKKAMGAMMGGMKKGGTVKRKGHANDGPVDEIAQVIAADKTPAPTNTMVMRRRAPSAQVPASAVTPVQARQMQQIMNSSAAESASADRAAEERALFNLRGYKKGGKAKARKAGGQVNYGPAENYKSKPGASTAEQIAIEKKGDASSKPTRGKAQHYAAGGGTQPDARLGIVKPRMLDFGSGAPGMKKGGEAWEGSKKDEAQDKKLAKKHGMSMKAWEASKLDEKHDEQKSMKGLKKGGKVKRKGHADGERVNDDYSMDDYLMAKRREDLGDDSVSHRIAEEEARRRGAFNREHGTIDLKRGGKAKRPGKFYGGAMGGTAPQVIPPAQQSGMQMPPMMPNMGPSKPTGYAKGGKAKGKTNINIVISAGQKPQQPNMMPPAGGPDGGPAGGIPVPMAAGPSAPPAAAPMPMPMPMPMPAGAPPMPRKAGGRISKVASSYKDMTAGAGSGEGRLQKTDIAKRNARKAGGGVYRSYKDMDAGAGSGLGRLEKTEIQKRK